MKILLLTAVLLTAGMLTGCVSSGNIQTNFASAEHPNYTKTRKMRQPVFPANRFAPRYSNHRHTGDFVEIYEEKPVVMAVLHQQNAPVAQDGTPQAELAPPVSPQSSKQNPEPAAPEKIQESAQEKALPESAEVVGAGLKAGTEPVAHMPVAPPAPKVAPVAAAPKNTEKVQKKKVKREHLVCKRKVITGSRFTRKVCLTKARWEAQEVLGRKTADDMQSRGGRTNNPLGN